MALRLEGSLVPQKRNLVNQHNFIDQSTPGTPLTCEACGRTFRSILHASQELCDRRHWSTRLHLGGCDGTKEGKEAKTGDVR